MNEISNALKPTETDPKPQDKLSQIGCWVLSPSLGQRILTMDTVEHSTIKPSKEQISLGIDMMVTLTPFDQCQKYLNPVQLKLMLNQCQKNVKKMPC